MTDSEAQTNEHRLLGQAVDLAVRLAFLGLVVFWCNKIVAPFFLPVLWGVVIAVALYPVFLKLKGWLGGRNNLAGVLLTVASLVLVIVPAVMLAESLIASTNGLAKGLEEGTLSVPAPTESVKDWPVIGERVYPAWQEASRSLGELASDHSGQVRSLVSWLVDGAASLGGAMVQMIFSLIIAGIFMVNAIGGGRVAYAFAEKMDGDRGREMVDLSISTIRSVVRGVLLVAIIQSLMAAAGLVFAGVPGAGFWAFLVLIVAIVQLPPILILGPIAVYVFSANDSTAVAVIFLVWSLAVSGSDGVLKPMLLGRGVAVPMLVILIGAIGGMIASGVIGLFIGAVILSLGYKLAWAWLGDTLQRKESPS